MFTRSTGVDETSYDVDGERENKTCAKGCNDDGTGQEDGQEDGQLKQKDEEIASLSTVAVVVVVVIATNYIMGDRT